MQNQKTIFTECQVLCRPLVLVSRSSKSYIELPYAYKLKDIKDLQTYTCPSIRIVGVDFIEKYASIPKTKYKKILHAEIDSDSNERLNFRKIEQYQRFFWVVDVAISHAQSLEELRNFIKENLAISINIEGLQQFVTEQYVNSESLKKSLVYVISAIPKNQKKNGKKVKVFSNKIEVGLVLEKRQSYPVSRIMELLTDQLSNSINIMQTNQLLFQTNKWHQELLPIRNFYKNSNDKDAKFERLCSTVTAQQIKKPQIKQLSQENAVLEKGESKKEKIVIVGLVVILVLVIGVYFSLRFLA